MRTTLKQLVRAGLRSLGYDLRRLPEDHTRVGASLRGFRSSTDDERADWYIEFIGPSGVGKTTLYNELIRRRETEDTWQTAPEFLQSSIQLIIDPEDLIPEYEPLLELELADICRSNDSSTHSFGAIAARYRVVVRDAKIRRSRLGRCVVSDDHFCHYFSSSLIKLSDQEPAAFDRLAQKRAIINCVSSPEAITRQIRERERLGHVMRLHEGLDDQQLTELSVGSLAHRAALVSRLTDHQVPCLTLHTAEHIRENARRIREFIGALERRGQLHASVWGRS